MAKPKAKDLARAADESVIANATAFTVVKFVGRTGREPGPVSRDSLYERTEFNVADYSDRAAALAAARAKRDELGCDDHGRVPVIYAVGTTHNTVHVE